MKTAIFSLFLLLFSVSAFGDIPEKPAIDKIFSEWNKPGSPGGSIGIIKNGELIYARGYGLANLEYDIANSPQSVFRIASTSKQFTAASIIILSEQGKLSLSDNLHTFFPEFPDYAKSITIQHILNHTSGLRDYFALSMLAGLNEEAVFSDEDLMNWLVNQQGLNFKPGAEFLYSNTGYWMLGQIVEKVSGLNLAEFADKEIFQPLGMNHSHFHNDRNRIVKNRASGYEPTGKDTFGIYMTALEMIGDGGLFTTVEDLKKWDDAFYASEIFGKNFWQKMTQPGKLNSGKELDYASGLVVRKYNGLNTIRHGGAFAGFRAEFLRVPSQKFSVILLANRADANPEKLVNQVADIFLQDSYTDNARNVPEKKNSLGQPVKLTAKELHHWAGHYWNHEESYSRKIYVKNNSLFYFRSEHSESELIPLSNNEFSMKDAAGAKVRFTQNAQGQKSMAFIFNNNDPIESIEYQPVNYTRAQLEDFIGSYFSEELKVTYQLKMQGDALHLFINNKHTAPITPVRDDLLATEFNGVLHFNRDKTNQVVAFDLSLFRITNLRFMKR